MASMGEMFRDVMSKSKDICMKEATLQIGYPSGFLNLDYKNAMRVVCEDYDTGDIIKEYDTIGVADGGINVILGLSGTGKSTLAMKMAAKIVEPYPDSCIFYEDAEGTMTAPRFRSVTGWGNRRIHSQLIHRDSGLTTQNTFDRIKAHADLKTENAKSLIYRTSAFDLFGKPIKKLTPSVFIIDSWYFLMPEAVRDCEDLAGNTAGMTQARVNSDFIKQVRPICKKANIILFIINHIRPKTTINKFEGGQAQVNYMKMTEHIPGGSATVYAANNIWKLVSVGGYDTQKLLGFDGFLVRCEFIKSKTNKAGQSVSLLYNQSEGYDNLYSLLYLLDEHKLILGNNPNCKLQGLPSVNFSKKTFLRTYNSNLAFRIHFKNLVMPILESYVVSYEEVEAIALRDEQMLKEMNEDEDDY